jgi:lauroyl/myristoyl acyltransferase
MEEGVKEKPKLMFRLLESAFMAQFYVTKALSYILPPSILYLIPKAIGAAFFYARPGMRRRLEAKISDAMPEITDPRELSRIGRQACGSVFMPFFDIFTLTRHGDRYMRGLRLEGMEELERAEAEGKGVILTGPHTGGITIIHAVMAKLGKPYTPIAFNPKDTVMPRYVETLEFYSGILGCDVDEPVFFVGEDIIPKVKKHLAAGKRIGLTFDVDGNAIVDFFGRPAALASGVAHFAYDSGSPIVAFSLQRGKGPLDNLMKVYGTITPDPSSERRSEVARMMREVVDYGEQTIRDIPGQWLSWFGLWQWWDKAREIMEKKAQKQG